MAWKKKKKIYSFTKFMIMIPKEKRYELWLEKEQWEFLNENMRECGHRDAAPFVRQIINLFKIEHDKKKETRIPNSKIDRYKQRIGESKEAVLKFIEEGKPIPGFWIDEYNDLCEMIQQKHRH